MIALACPLCRAALERLGGEELVCGAGHRFPVHFGIPDLRVGGDPYLSIEDDLAAARRLLGSRAAGFRGMLEAYYAENPKVSAAQAQRFAAGAATAVDRAHVVLGAWEALAARDVAASRVALDLGAGTGGLSVALAQSGRHVVALDAGLRWLVVAAERCREAGVDVQFVCANAEAMPLPDGSVDVVAGESVLENVQGQASAVRESRRVLRARGALWLTTPNRLFPGPDPHVGMLAGGWFSDAVVARYAARHGMVPPRRTLLSKPELATLLREGGFRALHCAAPDVSEAQRRAASPVLRAAVDAYRVVRRMPIAREALLWAGPTILATSVRD